MRSPNRLAAAALAASLAGCAAVGPDFKRPEPPAAAGYAMAGDPVAATAVMAPEARASGVWWSALGSPELDRVIRLALADSPTLAEANAVLARARAQADSARGRLGPDGDLDAAARRRRINIQSIGFSGLPSPTVTLYDIGGTVSYDLDLFGGKRRAAEARQSMAEAEARRAEAAYLSLTANVALAAVRIASLRAEIDAVEATIADDRRVSDLTEAAERAGGEARSALSSTAAQLAQDEALLPPLQKSLTEARHRLALLVGQPPAGFAAPDFQLAAFTVPSQIPVEVPSSLARRRPDILAAEADLHAATAEIGVRTAELYPKIGLTAQLTQTSRHPDNLFNYSASGWTLGGALTAPILQRGALKADKRAAEADARAAMARYQQTVLSAFVQVADSLADLAHTDLELAALRRSEAAAAANLRDAETAYRLGGGPLLRTIDAQRQLSQARRARVRAEAARLEGSIRLYAALAADWRDAPSAPQASLEQAPRP
jgi:NodT family efflux transporter outer membrane factor (OMF) lipoprotein